MVRLRRRAAVFDGGGGMVGRAVWHSFSLIPFQNELRAYITRSMIITGGVVCSQVVNTSNSGSGGSGFKPRPSRCFLRQGTLPLCLCSPRCINGYR